MIKVEVVNHVPIWKTPSGDPKLIENVGPKEACQIIRDTFSNRGDSLKEWSDIIRSHGILPLDDPYRIILEQRNIPEDDYLWTLGSLAFGSSREWISIYKIEWEDGTKSTPEEDHKRQLLALPKSI